jgi:hypothetical protein
MGKKEVNQEEVAITCLCPYAIPLYPSITFAIYNIFSQSMPDRNKRAIMRSWHCKLSCVVPLSLPFYYLLLMVYLLKNVDLISSEANPKIGHILCKMQYLIMDFI